MSAKIHPFTVGHIRCTVLFDSNTPVDNDRFMKRFPNGNEADYRQAYADIGLDFDAADSAINILLIQTDDACVLVDTGERGASLDSLQAAHVSPDEVTLVIITHTHGDHVNGLLTDDGQPTFPNARYVISQREMQFWKERIAHGLDNQAMIDLLEKQGVTLIEPDAQILPHIQAVPIPGHTPGQIAVKISTDDGGFIHMADLLHSPMQFAHPEWSARFDDDTAVSVPTRQQALGMAADENLLTMFYHLTFPGLGYVARDGENYRWKPIS